MAQTSTKLSEGVNIATGYGEIGLMKRLNNKWKDEGNCIRLSQRYGDPEALSDLIFAIAKGDTYSIEVKRITNKATANHTHHKTRAFNFTSDFSVTKREVEYPHQLVRQVRLCDRMGWCPLVFLQVVTPKVGTEEYLFNSPILLEMMNEGAKGVPSEMFNVFSNQLLYDYLLKSDKI